MKKHSGLRDIAEKFMATGLSFEDQLTLFGILIQPLSGIKSDEEAVAEAKAFIKSCRAREVEHD